jgi:hypothetical protein
MDSYKAAAFAEGTGDSLFFVIVKTFGTNGFYFWNDKSGPQLPLSRILMSAHDNRTATFCLDALCCDYKFFPIRSNLAIVFSFLYL